MPHCKKIFPHFMDFIISALLQISECNFLTGEEGGGGNSIVFHLVTGKSLGSLVQISKGYDRYLDERGRGKAKKLANIGTYRLFDRMCVSFGVAIICLCKPF